MPSWAEDVIIRGVVGFRGARQGVILPFIHSRTTTGSLERQVAMANRRNGHRNGHRDGRRNGSKRRGRRPQGFSVFGSRVWGSAFRGTGIQGRQRRQFFNQIASGVALYTSLGMALLCWMEFGFVTAVIVFFVLYVLMTGAMRKGRLYR